MAETTAMGNSCVQWTQWMVSYHIILEWSSIFDIPPLTCYCKDELGILWSYLIWICIPVSCGTCELPCIDNLIDAVLP